MICQHKQTQMRQMVSELFLEKTSSYLRPSIVLREYDLYKREGYELFRVLFFFEIMSFFNGKFESVESKVTQAVQHSHNFLHI